MYTVWLAQTERARRANTQTPACVSSNGHVSPSSDTSVLTEDFKCRGVKDRPGLTHV